MVIDTSAVVAILLGETEGAAFAARMSFDQTRLISVASFVEASIVLDRRRRDVGRRDLDRFMVRAGLEVVPVDRAQGEMAREAYHQYGRGRHRANLNFGDCFAYALAKTTGEPLLYKGTDFGLTDVATA
ncbi:MAG: type II toxin-antitoxin system VapC family toxin [Alphaproteobacteria bacterium]|nr:type II toxin-antitoxin system VapC family toxin [Alphaproteobacteria bacterium]